MAENDYDNGPLCGLKAAANEAEWRARYKKAVKDTNRMRDDGTIPEEPAPTGDGTGAEEG